MPHKIELYGVVGSEWWGVTASMVIEQLRTIALNEDDKDVELHINSAGGYVDHAMAIYNRLRRHAKEHGAKITTIVDGLAASAASLIAMAGDTIEMPENATMMIHRPWGLVIGEVEDMERYAARLRALETQMVKMYLAQAKDLDEDELRALLAAETWLTAEEAHALGLVDVLIEPDEDVEDLAAAAAVEYLSASQKDHKANLGAAAQTLDEALQGQPVSETLPDYQKPPIWWTTQAAAMQRNQSHARGRAQTPQEPKMPTKTKSPEAGTDNKADDQNTTTPPSEPVEPTVTAEQRKAIQAEERERVEQIRAAGTKMGVSKDAIKALINDGIDIVAAKAQMIDILAAQKPELSGIQVQTDARDNGLEGMQAALEYRAGVSEDRKKVHGNLYASASLGEIAMKLSGEPTVEAAVRAVFSAQASTGITHTASDFSYLTANVAEKAMLKGWDESPEVFGMFTNRGSLPNFKTANRVDINGISSLEEVNEAGQIPLGTLSDRGVTIQLGEFGKRIGITRKTIMNDDLDALGRVPMALGRAARRTVADQAIGHITDNTNYADGIALFHAASHSNDESAAALSESSLADAIAAMWVQTDPETGAVLNIRPKYLFVPAALRHTARKLVQAQVLNNDTNVMAGELEVLVDGRLDADSGTAWYLIADPASYDTIEVAYLNGVDAPRLRQRVGFEVSGIEHLVELDFGTSIRDFRTFVRNLGA